MNCRFAPSLVLEDDREWGRRPLDDLEVCEDLGAMVCCVGWWIGRREKKRGRVVGKKERMIRPQTDPGSQTICSGGAGRMGFA